MYSAKQLNSWRGGDAGLQHFVKQSSYVTFYMLYIHVVYIVSWKDACTFIYVIYCFNGCKWTLFNKAVIWLIWLTTKTEPLIVPPTSPWLVNGLCLRHVGCVLGGWQYLPRCCRSLVNSEPTGRMSITARALCCWALWEWDAAGDN